MQPSSDPSWRGDVQGLRAVAVIGVLVFHAGVPIVSGGFTGVDVFFVISGFLITRNLLRQRASTGRIRLGAFFVGRLVRLAPAAVATVAATLGAVYLALPPLDRVSARADALAAILGVENVQLARTGTDYLADHAASPFQQFWSLGVEEQFYLGWALLLATLCAVPFTRRHLGVAVASVCAISFGTLLVVAPASGPWAFFGIHTRAWELGLGALAAVVCDRAARNGRARRRRPRRPLAVARAAGLAGLVGLILITTSYVVFDETTPFPGPLTLVPVVGALLIVAPLSTADPVRQLLGSAPLTWVGDRSYSLYLWHWPLLVVPPAALGRALTDWEIAGALALTLVIGHLSHRYLERGTARWARVHRVRPVALVAAGAALAVAVVPLTALPVLHTDQHARPADPDRVLAGPVAPAQVPANLTPAITSADDSTPGIYRDGCHTGITSTAVPACPVGASPSSVGPIVLFGDSHAAQWTTPLETIARASGRQLVTLTKSACPAVDLTVESPELGRSYHECTTWRTSALERLTALEPSLVIVASASSGYDGLVDTHDFTEAWRSGLERTLRALSDRTSAAVVVLQDTPRWTDSPNRCLSASIDDIARCSQPTQDLVDADLLAAERQAAAATGATTIDPVPWICTERCAPVLWNVLAYRDSNHITDMLARALTPRLDAALPRTDGPGAVSP